jgi:hypothetical protein
MEIRRLFFYFTVLFLSITMSSCSKDDDNDDTNDYIEIKSQGEINGEKILSAVQGIELTQITAIYKDGSTNSSATYFPSFTLDGDYIILTGTENTYEVTHYYDLNFLESFALLINENPNAKILQLYFL